MTKADDVFWREFGVVLILLTIFGFAMYFLANAIGGRAHAKMVGNPDTIAERIAPFGQSRIGDPAGQTTAQVAAAALPASTAAAQTAPDTRQEGATGSASQTAATGVTAGEDVYRTACSVCHMNGVAGSPKLDDKAEWESRFTQEGGMDGLVKSATLGKGAMPPKGGFMHLTEEDLRNAIGFMLGEAGLPAGG